MLNVAEVPEPPVTDTGLDGVWVYEPAFEICTPVIAPPDTEVTVICVLVAPAPPDTVRTLPAA